MGAVKPVIRSITTRASAAFAAALLACGDSGGPTELPPVAEIVQSVEIEALDPSRIEVGIPLDLRVAPRDANGVLVPGARVAWSSLDPEVASVDSNGRVQPLAPGSMRIVAAVGAAADTVTVQAVAPLDFVALDAGWSHTCGVTRDGAAYCWGSNSAGELGDGTTDPSDRPVAVAGGHLFASVSAGVSHTCGITTAGEAYCWGRNSQGELGNGSIEPSDVPVPVAGGQFTVISTGSAYTCGILEGGHAVCWGRNLNGQLGNGQTDESSMPVQVAGGHTFVTIDAGSFHTCAVAEGGAGYCWGSGELGVDGLGRSYVPIQIDGGLALATISAGNGHSCAVAVDGRAYCWGGNVHGEVGNGTFAPDDGFGSIESPTEVVGGHRFTSVIAGSSSTCGMTTAARAVCWGSGHNGALGNGDDADVNRPTAVLLETVAGVTVEQRVGCAFTPEGRAYCWGENTWGALGTGNNASSLAPRRVTVP